MSRHVVTVRPHLPVRAAAALLVANGVTSAPVVTAEGVLRGIVTGADLACGRPLPDRVHRPLPAAGELSVESEITDLQDKGEGRNAIVTLTGRGSDPDTGELVTETVTTLVLRGHGGFGGSPVAVPGRDPDVVLAHATDDRLPLVYRLSGDRNPLHSDPWFAREKAGFPQPILHGLCTYGAAPWCRASATATPRGSPASRRGSARRWSRARC